MSDKMLNDARAKQAVRKEYEKAVKGRERAFSVCAFRQIKLLLNGRRLHLNCRSFAAANHWFP